jgi:hypothetical protein
MEGGAVPVEAGPKPAVQPSVEEEPVEDEPAGTAGTAIVAAVGAGETEQEVTGSAGEASALSGSLEVDDPLPATDNLSQVLQETAEEPSLSPVDVESAAEGDAAEASAAALEAAGEVEELFGGLNLSS